MSRPRVHADAYRDGHADGYAEGVRAGAAKMREDAATACEDGNLATNECCAEAIRALPLPEWGQRASKSIYEDHE